MEISLVDDSLRVQVYYDKTDCEFEDNVCVSIVEECPDEEKVFRADETNLYLTPQQARQLAEALVAAAGASCDDPGSADNRHD